MERNTDGCSKERDWKKREARVDRRVHCAQRGGERKYHGLKKDGAI